MCFHFMNCLFGSGLEWQTYVQPTVKLVLTKTCFQVHCIYSSVNFTCFAHLSDKNCLLSSVQVSSNQLDLLPF